MNTRTFAEQFSHDLPILAVLAGVAILAAFLWRLDRGKRTPPPEPPLDPPPDCPAVLYWKEQRKRKGSK